MSIKILFLGDIVGRIGRSAVSDILPVLKRDLQVDFVLGNAENLAHGKGVTVDTLSEMVEAGIDVFTSGNHIFRKGGYEEILNGEEFDILRPANYPEGVPGKGYCVVEKGNKKLAIINLMGRVFFKEDLDDPFAKIDKILEELKLKHGTIPTILDWHAEATSEKVCMGWHCDGRLSAVLGTHTHVPTADQRILPQGTGYISDVGMVGARDSSLGVELDGPMAMFLSQLPATYEIPESGPVQINGVYLEIDEKTAKTTAIKRVDREVIIV